MLFYKEKEISFLNQFITMKYSTVSKNKCRICSNSDLLLINDIKSEKSYIYCNNCEFISLSQNHIVSKFDEINRYKLHNNTFNNKGYIKYLNDFISNIKKKTTCLMY